MSWFLFVAYCSNVYLYSLYQWWTAGLHRLPYIAFAIMAIFYFLRFRVDRKKAAIGASAMCTLAATGFFTKGVLIPVYLLAIELSLVTVTAPREIWRNLRVIALFVAAAGAFLLLWRHVEPPGLQQVNKNVQFQLEFLRISWLILRDSTLGLVRTVKPDDLGLSFGLWVAALTYTVSRRRDALLPWLALLCVLAINVLLTSLSKHRTQTFGTAITLSARYYYELLFPIAIFVALAFRIGREPAALSTLSARVDPARWSSALCATALIALVTINGYASAKAELAKGGGAKNRAFVMQLENDLRRIPAGEKKPLLFVDRWPPQLNATVGMMLAAMKVEARAAAPGPGVYKLTETGRLVPSI